MVVLARRVRPEDWAPSGVEELEPNALVVARSTENRSVIAGPGAGKTELLAQRAAYLLQTGSAPTPRRILAISYKRDAATNLAARVRLRCHRSHSARFDSMTFDAFAKGLLDRFGQILPARWRPRPDYEILWTDDRMFRDFLRQGVGVPPSVIGTRADILAIGAKDFERVHMFGRRLPTEGWPHPSPAEWAADRFWQSALHEGPRSRLSFPMIGRLVELLLRLNPMACRAMRLTYSHLFMDEFQDATQVQYDLVTTIFRDSTTVVTAVGDNKQQIMRWAMAMPDPFAAFDADFRAIRTPLFNNYRSSPELVRIQHVLARALDPAAAEPISKARRTIDGESCVVIDFTTPLIEATFLANSIATEMRQRGLAPRDFVMLVRQLAGNYARVLDPAFRAAGLTIRNEAESIGGVALQDLLPDEMSRLVIALLRLATSPRAGRYWSICLEELGALRGLDPEDASGQALLARELDAFATDLARRHPEPPVGQPSALSLVREIVGYIGRDRLLAAYPAYAQAGWFSKVGNAIVLHLAASAAGDRDWQVALDAYEGIHAIPLMTIHKSKGLEYHTVVFVGLDDDAWRRSFQDDPVEATASFFVAFTRAKQRVVFTYCALRGERRAVATLYQLLQGAGVRIIQGG